MDELLNPDVQLGFLGLGLAAWNVIAAFVGIGSQMYQAHANRRTAEGQQRAAISDMERQREWEAEQRELAAQREADRRREYYELWERMQAENQRRWDAYLGVVTPQIAGANATGAQIADTLGVGFTPTPVPAAGSPPPAGGAPMAPRPAASGAAAAPMRPGMAPVVPVPQGAPLMGLTDYLELGGNAGVLPGAPIPANDYMQRSVGTGMM